MKKSKTAEDIATERIMIITSLLEPDLDPQQIIQTKKDLCEKHKISYRTISRYY